MSRVEREADFQARLHAAVVLELDHDVPRIRRVANGRCPGPRAHLAKPGSAVGVSL